MVVEGFVRSLGLEAEDVPKVVGTFVCCKYMTWGAGIALGVRYQPLRRILLARNSISKAQPWAQRQRVRLLEVWERARKTPSTVHIQNAPPWRGASTLVETAKGFAGRSATAETLVGPARLHRRCGARPSDIRPRFYHWRDAMSRAISAGWRSRAGKKLLQYQQLAVRQRLIRQKQFAQLRATYSAMCAGWRSRGSRKLLRFHRLLQHQRKLHQQQRKLRHAKWYSWYSWVSEKYWMYADKLETFAKTSSLGRFFQRNFGVKPQGLALGFAEGTILFKCTSPVVLPLQLWLLVNFFKRQRLQTFLANAPASCQDADLIENAASG